MVIMFIILVMYIALCRKFEKSKGRTGADIFQPFWDIFSYPLRGGIGVSLYHQCESAANPQ